MPLTRSSSEAEEVSVSEQSVEAAVSLTSLAHETSQSDVVVLSGHLAVFVALEQTRSNVSIHQTVCTINTTRLDGENLPQRSQSGPRRGPWR